MWHKAIGHDVLIDIEDVTMGSEKRLRPNERDDWVWSAETAQEPLIDPATFRASTSEPRRPVGASPRPT